MFRGIWSRSRMRLSRVSAACWGEREFASRTSAKRGPAMLGDELVSSSWEW